MNTIHTYNANDLELNILHILFMHKEKQSYIMEHLNKKFFSDPINSVIFEIARDLYFKGEEINAIVVSTISDNNEVMMRLAEIAVDVNALSPMTETYCKLLVEKYLKFLIKNAKTNDDLEEINSLKEKLDFQQIQIKHISDDVQDFEKRYNEKKETAIYSCYTPLDNYIGSFMGGDYIALGGSTGMGKSTIALNLARQFCMQDKTVLYFSLEMPLEQIQNRFVCMTMGLNAMKYRSFGFNLVEMQKYKEGLKHLKEWSLNVVTDYNLTCEKLKNYIKEQKKNGLDFVIIDYLGLMQGNNNKSLYEKSTIISRNIKLIATEMNVPILVLVQLNRDIKNRDDKRPKLSDIRESGAIEQDADMVLFAHREAVYNNNANANELEIIIAKNRHGSNNKIVKLNFDLTTQNISEF
jgi:replicative DNA helicase